MLSCFGTVQELCGKGGVLVLAQCILKLNIAPHLASARIVAAVSRLKAKMLSIVSPQMKLYYLNVKNLLGGLKLLQNLVLVIALCILLCRNSLICLLQLLNLCEAESISYLDEVASSPGSLDLAKSVALVVSFLPILCWAQFFSPFFLQSLLQLSSCLLLCRLLIY